MKKLSNFHRKVLNIVVTLMAAIALMLGNVTSVAAYTDMNGYPFVMDGMQCSIYSYVNGSFHSAHYAPGTLNDQNSYLFDFDHTVNSIKSVRFGVESGSLVVPVNLDVYDYYFVGTYFFTGSNSASNCIIFDSMYFYNPDENGIRQYTSVSGFNQIDFFSFSSGTGKSFYGKLDINSNANLSYAVFESSSFGTLSADENIWFSASIVPVAKSGTAADTLNSILQTLTQINQNLITNNTLQQQTIDAINQNTTNTSNWFTTLITTMQGWFNTQTENLRTWFYMIEERMSAGFTALYHQMTREQDEKLNGYTDTTQSDAADSFNTESDKLTELEDQLNDQSHDFVSDYTTS